MTFPPLRHAAGGYPLVPLLTLALMAVGCASPSVPAGISTPPGPAPSRTLVMVVSTEVSNLSPKAAGPTNPARTTRGFNADLTLADAQGNVRPYLAEALPQLGADTWRVFPDGRMQTTWTLRPGLTWHDGQALTAEDFAFAFQVYKAPDLGVFTAKPQDLIEQVVAVDPRTVRVNWRSSFLHQGDGLNPLPRALLAEPFAAFEQDPGGQREPFLSLRFWTTEYIGAGPYRLTTWEPASHLEGMAFDAHALGRPKIDRIVIRIINSENAALAALMAGQVHMTTSIVLRFEDGMTLRQQGGFNDTERKGTVLFVPASTNAMVFQHRSEYQQTLGLLDPRVRQALAYAIDREAISERLFEGQSPIPISFVSPSALYYAEVERSVTRYAFDPRKTEQLLTEVGYSRDRDGLFVSANQRLQPALWNSADNQHQVVAAIVLNTWQKAGIDAQQFVMPNSLERDQQARSTFPGILIHSIGGAETAALGNLLSDQISSPSNRWNGSNRGGWSNPAFDLQGDRYNRTLDRAEQIQAFVQAMNLHSEQLPNFPLHYNLQVITHVAGLKGPEADTAVWNLHEWEWQ